MTLKAKKFRKVFYLSSIAVLLTAVFSHSLFATIEKNVTSADRAVEIAQQSRDRVERNGKALQTASGILFKEFAQRTASLSKLIDAREQLESAGFLTKGDPEGDARRAHINGKILTEVAGLKKVCDAHLKSLLTALEQFDDTVAESIVDSQATRSINSNYELMLEQYVEKEKDRFNQAAQDAGEALSAYEDADDPLVKNRLKEKYNRAKKRVLQIEQRRKLYEARMKTAEMNQKISALLRERIREDGSLVSSKFRSIMASLYLTFSKVIPVAELGGTGVADLLGASDFENIAALKDTLEIVDSSVEKLGGVLDDMVNDVLAGLGDIEVVDRSGVSGDAISVEEEMEFLRQQRMNWNAS